jgi:cardiolipin-specific phospholipase
MLRQWFLKTSSEHLLASQAAILKHFVRDGYASVRTRLPSSGFAINSVDSGEMPPLQPNGAPTRTVVLAHGLGSGLGFFFSSYSPLLRANGGAYDRVIGVDWLGFGASSRPYVKAPRNRWWSAADGFSLYRSRFSLSEEEGSDHGRHAADGGVGGAAAAFFTDSLEEWAEVRKLDRFTLVGHSLGGYLAARYAMRHPHRVNGLVLASPAGLVAPRQFDRATALSDEDRESNAPTTDEVPLRYRLLDAAWSANVTPGQLFRAWSYLRFREASHDVVNIIRRRFG